MHKPVISQYLRRYAETGAQTSQAPAKHFDCVLVIPAYDESDTFLRRFLATEFTRSVLLIAVINAPDNAPADSVARSRALLASALQLRALADPGHGILIVDRVSTGCRLPAAGGVGLARKIGMDLALAFIDRNAIHSRAIWSSDADARLPADLFAHAPAAGEAALTFAFRHVGDAALAATQAIYDLRIGYYRAQLARCGSPYAFIALGSALAVAADGYAAVRGMPRRSAGEDFHILNKLAKTGLIRGLRDPCIEIEIRESVRVPFGTGPGVAQLHKTADPAAQPIFYAPQSFGYLAAWFALCEEFAALCEQGEPAGETVDELFATVGSGELDASLFAEVFDGAAARAALSSAARAGRSRKVCLRHLHTWFDGLKTLRSVHRLRDLGLANLSAREMRNRHGELLGAAVTQVDYLAGLDVLGSGA